MQTITIDKKGYAVLIGLPDRMEGYEVCKVLEKGKEDALPQLAVKPVGHGRWRLMGWRDTALGADGKGEGRCRFDLRTMGGS